MHTLKCATEEGECKNDVLVQELKRFWDLETLGIQPQCVYEEFLKALNTKITIMSLTCHGNLTMLNFLIIMISAKNVCTVC